MVGAQSYDYSKTELHIEPFEYAVPSTSFIEEDAESYGNLWRFKQHISEWTFGIVKQKGYVFFKYKIDDIAQFYTWNIMEKVESIKDHREHYIVIVLREVDEAGMATNHNHSIVIDVDETHGKFNLENLMASLQGTDMESLNKKFIAKKLLLWQEGSALFVVKRLRSVWQMLDRYTIVNVATATTAKKGNKRQPPSSPHDETTPKRGRGGSRPGSSRAEAQKRNLAQSKDSEEGTRKRSKPTGPERMAEGEGSASGVTTTQTETSRSIPPTEDFEKFAYI